MAFSVTYREMYGWPRSGWENGQFDAERRVRVAGADLQTFLTELDAYPNCQYPYDDGPPWATARKVKIHPFGIMTNSVGSLATYEHYLVQIWHTTRGPVWNNLVSAYVSETMFPAYHFKTVSAKNLKWKSDDKKVESNDEPQLDDCLYEYKVTFHRLTSLPAWVLTRPGVINSNSVAVFLNPVLGSWALTFAPKVLKYNGCIINSSWSLSRVARWDVTAKFLVKLSEWNKYWRHDTAAWEEMVTKDGNDYIQYQPVPITLL